MVLRWRASHAGAPLQTELDSTQSCFITYYSIIEVIGNIKLYCDVRQPLFVPQIPQNTI